MLNTENSGGLVGVMPAQFAVLDFEFQTYESCQLYIPDVYEIGSIRNTGEEFATFVKGVILTATDSALTGVTQEMVDGGIDKKEALLKLLAFWGNCPVFVWGFPDIALLSMHLWRNRIPFPRNVFYEARSFLVGLTGINLPRGLGEACKYLHLTRKGEHRAKDDAWTTLRVINAVVGLKEATPEKEPCIIVEV